MIQKRTAQQILKFSSVGVLNTALDLAVLDALILVFGTGPTSYFVCKAVAFIVAAANSYAWNKWWVFRHEHTQQSRVSAREWNLFLIMSLIGLFLNSGVSSFALSFLGHADPLLSPVVAANISALVGTLVVFSVNFTSYKFTVFQPKTI